MQQKGKVRRVPGIVSSLNATEGTSGQEETGAFVGAWISAFWNWFFVFVRGNAA